MKLEICVDSVVSALAAQEGGADRVELCDNLMEGGTTPSAGSIQVAKHRLQIGLQVIIRPRGGDFLYNDVEFDIMRHDIQVAKDLGADGVVIGLLTADGAIDTEATAELIEIARPMNVTFHRAFDMCADPFQALEQLIDLGIHRILTSGQEPSVIEGLDLIREIQAKAGDRIIIMPGGGGIDARNVDKVIQQTGVREIHLAAPHVVASEMRFRNPRVYMGGTLRPPEYDRESTDPTAVQSIRSRMPRR